MANTIGVYSVNTLEGYLISAMDIHVVAIPALVEDSADLIYGALQKYSNNLLFHLCLSSTAHFPKRRREVVNQLRRRSVRILNGNAVDITKNAVQACNVTLCLPATKTNRTGNPRDILIVKTNANCGGLAELRLSGSYCAKEDLLPPHPLVSSPAAYWVLRRSDVPDSFWVHSSLIIERFVANKYNMFFRAYVCGKTSVFSQLISNQLIKRPDIGTPRENAIFMNGHQIAGAWHSVPVDLKHNVWRFCSAMGIEFGTVDAVMDDHGTYYIVDANTTPFWGDEYQPGILGYLTEGLI
jgi:hypothetical protein